MRESQNNYYQHLWGKMLGNWYYFVLSLAAFIALAYYYLQSTVPTYQSEAMMLIKDDENSGQPNEEIFFSELGLGKKNKTLENEILVMKSSLLMNEVVKRLELQYQYTSINGLKKHPLYRSSPIRVLAWQPFDSLAEVSAMFHAQDGGTFRLVVDKQEYTGEYGKPVQLPMGNLTLVHKPDQGIDHPIKVDVMPVKTAAWIFMDALKVEIMGELSSTLHLAIKDSSPERARDVLNMVMAVYNEESVDIRNQSYENTINMINERIRLIADDLSETELNLEAYKRNYSTMDLSAEGNLLLTQMAGYNKQITETDVQLQILDGIENFLAQNQSNFEFVPTNLGINNLTLSSQIASFNDLLSQRAKLLRDAGPAHPDLVLTEKQIQNLRRTIIENIRSIRGDMALSGDATKRMRSGLESRMSSLPRYERQKLEIERQKSIKENLYLYLLQKREEAAVSLAVTVGRGRVVEPAEAFDTPVAPKRMQIWLIAFFLGLALPAAVIILTDGLSNKIITDLDVTNNTSVPLIAMLGKSRKKERLVVTESSRSPVAEMFRLLRANLQYVTPGHEPSTLLITSSNSGEGKSFIAINLGMTMALAGKKVLIVELDLRKPVQEASLGIERSKDGVVNYLINPKLSPFDIIRNTGMHPQLDVIGSGPIPPNPSELILSARLRELIDKLREVYDFIILDTPPVGRVADSLQMKDLAEATMYVVRHGYTQKAQLQILEDIAQKGKLPRPFVVMNGVPLNKPGFTGGYGYGYGYGYGDSPEKNYFGRKKAAAKKAKQEAKR